MKKLFICLNFLSLIIAIFWVVKSNYDNEPMIAVITLIGTLIGLFLTETKSKTININGNKNLSKQISKSSDVTITGDNNKTFQ